MQSVCRYLGGNTTRPYCDDLDNKDNALQRAGLSTKSGTVNKNAAVFGKGLEEQAVGSRTVVHDSTQAPAVPVRVLVFW